MVTVAGIISWADGFVSAITPSLNRIVAALVILFVGFIIGKIVRRVLERVLKDLNVDKGAQRLIKRSFPFQRVLSGTAAFLIYFIAVIMALNALGITTLVLTILFAIVLLTICISLLIAIKDFVPNMIGGLAVRQRNLFAEGDTILFQGTEGTVEELGLAETRLRRPNGDVLVVPNNLFRKVSWEKKSGVKKRATRKTTKRKKRVRKSKRGRT